MLLAAIGAYLALSLAVGFAAARRVRGASDFALARGRFGTAIVAAAVFATWFGAETVLGIPAAFLKDGLGGVLADPFGALGALVVVAAIFARPFFRLDALTLGDYFRRRFDRRTEVALSLGIAFSYLGWAAAQLVALGLAFSALSDGAIGADAGIVLGAAIVLAFTVTGGMWAVALTDAVQAVVIVAGLLYTAFACAELAGGAGVVVRSAVEAGRLRIAAPADWGSAFAGLAAILVVMLGAVPQQDVLQRVRSARSEAVAVRATLLGGLAYFAVALVPMFLMGAASLVDPAMVARLAAGDPQRILPTLVLERTPFAVQALFFGALVAAILSTASGALLAPGVVVAEDLVRPLLARAGPVDDARVLRAMRWAVALLGVAVTAMALASDRSIYDLVNNSGKVVLAGCFVPLAAGLFWPRANATGAGAAIALGLGAWGLLEWTLPAGPVPPVLAGLAASAAGMAAGSLLTAARPGA